MVVMMDNKLVTLAVGLFGAVAGAVVYTAAPATLQGLVGFLAFFALFALGTLGGAMLFDLWALRSGSNQAEVEAERQSFVHSGSMHVLQAILVGLVAFAGFAALASLA